MTVSDNRFGVVLVTEKGKNFIFDDPQCLASYLHSPKNSPQNSTLKKSSIYFTNFIGAHVLVNANEVFIIKSQQIHGPMNGSFAAFSNKDSAMLYILHNTGSIVKLNELLQ